MLETLNSGWWQTGGYGVVTALCICAAWRDRRVPGVPLSPARWPTFWIATGMLFLAMTVARLVDLSDVVTDLGKREAYAGGWYDSRRSFQSVAVAGLGLGWAIATLAAVWRVPERRRRYLPVAIVVIGLVFFAAIRVVSLHHVDTLLYRRHVSDVRVGVAFELSALSLVAALTVRQLARPRDRATPMPHAHIEQAPAITTGCP